MEAISKLHYIKTIITKYPNCIFYILSALVIVFQLMVLRYDILLKVDPHSSIITYGVRSIVDAFLLLLPFWLLPAKYRGMILAIIVLFTIWVLTQMWYYRTYTDLMPFSSYVLFNNISPLLINSAIDSMRLIDLLIIISISLLFAIYYYYIKIPIKKVTVSLRSRVIIISGILFFALIIYFANAFSYYNKEKGKTANVIWDKYINTTSSISYLGLNGFVVYSINAIVEAILEGQKLTQIEKEQIDNYIAQNKNNYTNNLFPKNDKQNLILIVVESLNSWVIDLKVDNIEVTPNLNKYCKEDNAIVALRIQPQVKNGRSSDAHLIFNTGLLPIKNGATAIRYGTNNFPTLAKALKGYSTFEVVCDDEKFWNQKNTSISYGFNKLYEDNDLAENGCTSDKIMFNKAIEILKKEPQPFYAQLVTISMHQPYDSPIVAATAISKSTKYKDNVLNYLEATHFFDKALSEFINQLKCIGLYDNTTIAIISDHNEMNKNVPDGREMAELTDMETAMIILNAPCSLNYKDVIGQVDVYPTLLDVMCANDYAWKGLGNSILRNPAPTSAVLWSGKIGGDKNSKFIPLQTKAWDISDLIITKHYFI